MSFSTEKKGYAREEVDAYLKKLTDEAAQDAARQKTRIQELKKQLAEAEKKIRLYREKGELVSRAITNAVAKADEIERTAYLRLKTEIEQIKFFHDKWTSYFNRILDKYPLDDELSRAKKFTAKLGDALKKVKGAGAGITDEDFIAEQRRVKKAQRIGYIDVDAEAESGESDEELMREIVPGADLSSPIITGSFDPIERINKYFSALEDEHEDFADRSPSGFSFEEAMNPKEDLSEIMRDLGFLLDDEA